MRPTDIREMLMKTKLLTFFLAIVASVGTMFAESGTCGDNLTWDLTDGFLNISGIGVMTNWSSYQDVPWYSYKNNITSVAIGNSVTSIGDYAFFECSSLTSVTISNSVTSIGYDAFAGCTSLTSIEIPNSITSIGSYAFSACTSLTSVTIPNSVTNIGKFVFSGCSNLTSITIPSSVASIGEGTFYYCSGLTSIVVEKGNAVYDSRDNCDALIETATNTLIYGCQNTIIPNSVTSIGEKAFYGCTGLTSITIPISVISFGERAFFECPNLTHVIWNARNASEAAEVFGSRRSSSPVESFVFGDEVEVIPDELCLGMSKLTNVMIPNRVKRIGASAFSGCFSLTSVNIPSGVTTIEYATFYGCSGLTSIAIPNNVTTIEGRAFEGCTGLTSIYNYAETPQSIDERFDYVDKSTCKLYVPVGSVDLYKAAEVWKEFENILPISAEKEEVDAVEVETTESEVSIAWPQVSGAYTYELVIKDKDGNIVCTLVFNAQGQLVSIKFNAPAQNGAPQHTQAAGFAFTITGLNSGSWYNYTLTSKNESGTILNVEEGTFRTNSLEAMDEVSDGQSRGTKFLRDGQILIQKSDKTFDLRGQEVK